MSKLLKRFIGKYLVLKNNYLPCPLYWDFFGIRFELDFAIRPFLLRLVCL